MSEGFGTPSDIGNDRIRRADMAGASERDSMIARDAIVSDAKHWLEREEVARSIADNLSDPDAKRMMLSIAEGYRRMAESRKSARRFSVSRIFRHT